MSKIVLMLVTAIFVALSAAGTLASAYDDALQVYESGDYAKAIAMLWPLANAGDGDALSLLAEVHEQGRGVPVDIVAAFHLAVRADALGNSYGSTLLGRYYLEGMGVSEDREKGMALLQKAADEHDVYAQDFLGSNYLLGADGLPKEPARAVSYLRAAAEAGYHESELKLGEMELSGDYGVTRDIPDAIRLLTMAGDQHFQPAELALWAAYSRGTGAADDRVHAAAWALVAARSGCARAIVIAYPISARQLSQAERRSTQAIVDEWEKRHPPHRSFDSEPASQAVCALPSELILPQKKG